MSKSLHTLEYEHFRSLLITAREKAGLTQNEIASRLSRPQSFVSKYETGERRLDLVEFVEVCRALGTDPQTIVAEVEARMDQRAVEK